MILVLVGAGVGVYKYRDSIFGPHASSTAATAADGGETATDGGENAIKQLHDLFDAARKQIVAGDYPGAVTTLKKLDDSDIITQPLQNWVTVNEGLVSLLQYNAPDARDWFKVVRERGHFSNDPSDSALVNFFSTLGDEMSSGRPIPASSGSKYALDSFEALGPLLFALKDWSLGKFDDAGTLLALYLSSTPKDPFQWVGEYKPIAQKYADQEAAYEKAAAAAAAADTPDARAGALKQVRDLEPAALGKMADKLKKMEADIEKKSAELDAAYNQRVAALKQQDDSILTDAKRKYAACCADFRFDDARAAIDAAAVTGSDAVREKQAILKKADWLRQFKTQLMHDVNLYGYAVPLVNRTGGTLPDGPKKATDTALLVQTPFGTLPFPWNTLPASALLAMANSYAQKVTATAPQLAADREWLAGVFACEEGMPRDGRTLLVQASQVKDEYKDELGLFLESQ
jgi:hypothetical protein